MKKKMLVQNFVCLMVAVVGGYLIPVVSGWTFAEAFTLVLLGLSTGVYLTTSAMREYTEQTIKRHPQLEMLNVSVRTWVFINYLIEVVLWIAFGGLIAFLGSWLAVAVTFFLGVGIFAKEKKK